MYRMTNREVENTPSPFLAYVMKPLSTLSDTPNFTKLSKNVQCRLYETVFRQGLVDLAKLIDGIVSEEKKMHESLKKYKKDGAQEGQK